MIFPAKLLFIYKYGARVDKYAYDLDDLVREISAASHWKYNRVQITFSNGRALISLKPTIEDKVKIWMLCPPAFYSEIGNTHKPNTPKESTMKQEYTTYQKDESTSEEGPKKFWMVLGSGNPAVKHETRAKAELEATRLSENTRSPFFVLEAVSLVKPKSNTEVIEL